MNQPHTHAGIPFQAKEIINTGNSVLRPSYLSALSTDFTQTYLLERKIQMIEKQEEETKAREAASVPPGEESLNILSHCELVLSLSHFQQSLYFTVCGQGCGFWTNQSVWRHWQRYKETVQSWSGHSKVCHLRSRLSARFDAGMRWRRG